METHSTGVRTFGCGSRDTVVLARLWKVIASKEGTVVASSRFRSGQVREITWIKVVPIPQ
jgi:hypothetical protein